VTDADRIAALRKGAIRYKRMARIARMAAREQAIKAEQAEYEYQQCRRGIVLLGGTVQN
jgi:hypothetical protein